MPSFIPGSTCLLAAWNDEQLDSLDGIVARAHANGVGDVGRVSRRELARREPALSDRALGVVEVPGEAVIDPRSTPLAYLRQAVRAGADYRFRTEVTGGAFDGESWDLETGQGRFRGRMVVNCTGTRGDMVERIGRPPDFDIRPRKG